jgi:hypothetical protein
MDWHPETLMLLAKHRHDELVREARQLTLAQRAAKASGRAPSLISRLLAAWGRRVRLSQASEPAMSEQAPQ